MKITQTQLAEMIVMMDKDGDGTVDKVWRDASAHERRTRA